MLDSIKMRAREFARASEAVTLANEMSVNEQSVYPDPWHYIAAERINGAGDRIHIVQCYDHKGRFAGYV